MIYLKLRQAGHVINHTRVDRLYTEARLQLKRRRRKQIPRADHQPLVRPERRNQVWSADFVFDRTADGRVMKCLTIVDDATHEAVAIVPARAFGRLPVTRVLDRLAITRGLPQILRTDNGKEFCGRAMLTWAHTQGLTLRLIEPGKPNQNAYIESFNGRFRDECLNEHWLSSFSGRSLESNILNLYYSHESVISIAWPMSARVPLPIGTRRSGRTARRSRGCGRWQRERSGSGISCDASGIRCDVSTSACSVSTID